MDSKGKDLSPAQTIQNIKDILNQLGLTTEEIITDSLVGTYSVYLKVICDNQCIGYANGKGVNLEYALASAYGECLERLSAYDFSNIFIYDKFPSQSINKYDILLYPDERKVSLSSLYSQKDKLFTYFKNFFVGTVDSSDVLSNLGLLDGQTVRVVPYVNKSSSEDETTYIPVTSFQWFIGSTGLCAGNSYEEAVCQGIFEIMERYCTYKIIKDKLTPPNIPDEVLMKYPKIWEAICKIREMPDKEFFIKDCSLGEGFPVVAAVILDKSDHSYLVNFGSSFIESIAIERTITELFQGRDIKNYDSMKYYAFSDYDANENIRQNIINGCGEFPPEFFFKKSSYDYQNRIFVSVLSNRSLYKHTKNFLRSGECSLYVRDNSFLGFNAYSVIIPELMPNVYQIFKELNESANIRMKLCKYNLKLKDLSDKEIFDYIKIVKQHFRLNGSLPLLNKSTKYFEFNNSLLSQYEDINMLMAIFCDIVGDYKEAYLYTNDFINNNLKKITPELEEDLYFIRDYFNLRARGLSNLSEVISYLKILYKDTMINKFLKFFNTQKGVLFYFYGENCGANELVMESTTKCFDSLREYMISHSENDLNKKLQGDN